MAEAVAVAVAAVAVAAVAVAVEVAVEAAVEAGRRRWWRWWAGRRVDDAQAVEIAPPAPLQPYWSKSVPCRASCTPSVEDVPALVVVAVDRLQDLVVLVVGELEVGRSAGPEVLGAPLDVEDPVRGRARDGREDALARAVGAQVVPVREEGAAVAWARQADVRELAAAGRELQRPVRVDVHRRVRDSVDVDRERQRDRRRAVVAGVPGVGRAGDDRLAGLGRDRVVRARGRGHGEVDVVGAFGGRQHEMEADVAPAGKPARGAAHEAGLVRAHAAGRDVRIVRVPDRDRDPRRRRGQHAADRVRIGVAGVAHALIEAEVLARIDVAVRVAVEEAWSDHG